jgi:hypothetical protein
MIQFDIPDCLLFLPRSFSAMLMADVSVAAISYVVASMAKNPEQVLTIPGGSASVVVPMDRTTPSMEDKVGTSSAEAPMTQALVARPESEASDDNLGGDAPILLNAAIVGYKIACRMSSQLQMCWLDSGKLGCPVWNSGWSSFHAP